MTEEQKLYNLARYNQFRPPYDQDADHFCMSVYSMASMKVDLIWLYNYMEIKADESEQRGKPVSDEYKRSIEVVKRSSMFITEYCKAMEKLMEENAELKRRNDYLATKLPKIKLKDAKISYVDGTLKYVDNLPRTEDNF